MAATCLLALVALAHAQGFDVLIYDVDNPLLQSTPTGCNGSPYPDGAIVNIYWDIDSNGPDADDPLADLGGPYPVNFNSFPINGEADLGVPGGFYTISDFASLGGMPTPPRYYLVLCSGADWNLVSNVQTLSVGPQEWAVNSWTCVDSLCSGCLPPPAPSDLVASTNRCDGVLLTWTYPSGVPGLDQFRIVRDGNLIATVTDTSLRAYLDVSASGTGIAYQMRAHKSCDALSGPAQATGARLPAPPTPTGMTASENSCNQVTFNWTYSSNAGLERWVFTRNGVPVDSIPHNGQVPGGRSYTYMNAPAGEALYCVYGSSTACGWGTAACDSGQALSVPLQVQNVSATDGLCGTTTVTWTDVAGETAYQVWRSNQDGSGAVDISGNLAPNTITYNDNTGTAGTIYRYWVVATNACGTSPTSAYDLGSRLATPVQPTGLTASDGTDCNAVILNWANVPGETGFRIWRDGIVRDSVAADVLTYNDVTAVPGTTYSYQVGSFNACGSSALSTADNGFRGLVPAQVANVQATDTRCDSVVVTWDAVTGATLYRIRQDGNDIGTATGTRFAHAPAAGTYAYTVTAESVCGGGPVSNPDNGTRISGTPLPQVPNVSATDNNCTDLVITWGNIAGEDSFQIRRNGARVGSVLTDVLTFTDGAAVPWTTYTYRVVGYNACGGGDTTGADQGTLPQLPGQVTGVAATEDRCDSVVVTWDAQTGSVTYHIQRNGTEVGNTTGLRYAEQPPLGTYSYTVFASSICGNGQVSAANDGTRLTAPQAPAWVDASDDTCAYVRVNWGAANGMVDAYFIYRSGVLIHTVSADTTDYAYNDTPAPGQYQYAVRAHSNFSSCPDGPSVSDSGRVHGTPNAPANLTVGPVVCDQVNLNWNAAVGEVDGYIIFRDGTDIDSTTATTYADTGLNSIATHNYVVRAYNVICGQGNASNQVSGHIRELLVAPTLPNDTLASGSTIQLTLDHCANVSSDSVFLSLNGGAYSFLASFSPVQGSINLTLPTVPTTTPNNRLRFISTRAARRDTVVTIPFVIEALAADEFGQEIPTAFFLDQNYPNPFNPETTVRFGVPHTAMVTIEVYDVTGRRAATLVNEPMEPGVHTVVWNCSQCPSGMYILRMKTDEKTMMRKMLMMK
jgi:hypothetical protein